MLSHRNNKTCMCVVSSISHDWVPWDRCSPCSSAVVSEVFGESILEERESRLPWVYIEEEFVLEASDVVDWISSISTV